MLSLFKALIMPQLDYGCIVQRSFTRFIFGMNGMSYPQRLTILMLYYLQHRRERYIIIYMWTFFEGLVPNIFPPICTKASDHRGRTCITSHINVGRLGTLEYYSFIWRAIRLFNQLPLYLRNSTVTVCSQIR